MVIKYLGPCFVKRFDTEMVSAFTGFLNE